MLCNRLHKFENILSQGVTLEIWISMFKNIGNRLHAHGNRLLLCKSIIKLFWASGNRLRPSGNRLPESKNSGKRFFFENFFWTNCAIQSFLWKILFILILMFFLRFLHILSLLLNLALELSLLLNLHLNLLDFFNLVWKIFGIIKIILEALLLQSPPFWWWQILKSREYMQYLIYRSLISFSPFLFEFMLNFKAMKI